jgi:hypothetical protein
MMCVLDRVPPLPLYWRPQTVGVKRYGIRDKCNTSKPAATKYIRIGIVKLVILQQKGRGIMRPGSNALVMVSVPNQYSAVCIY